jgi:hypothetical protein
VIVVAHVPQYFFHIRDGQELITDDEGLDFADSAEAKQQAARAVGEMVRDALAKMVGGAITVDVMDSLGTLRFRVSATFTVEAGHGC